MPVGWHKLEGSVVRLLIIVEESTKVGDFVFTFGENGVTSTLEGIGSYKIEMDPETYPYAADGTAVQIHLALNDQDIGSFIFQRCSGKIYYNLQGPTAMKRG